MEVHLAYFILLIACIFFSAFFSCAETALTSLSESKTRQMIDGGHRIDRALRLWLTQPNRVLTATLIGSNIANALAASIATVLAQELFAHYAIAAAVGSVTLLILIFGEITPKTFAKHNAEALAPYLMNILLPFYWLLFPSVYSLTWLAGVVVRFGGGATSKIGPTATGEDIAFMIRLGHQEGALPREEGIMLESIIEFRDTVAKEVMVPRTEISSFSVDATRADILSQIEKYGHSRWPVYRDNIDNIVGIVYAKDLLIAGQNNEFKITNHLRPAVFVPEMLKIKDILKEFQRGKAHLAIVVDEYGGTSGIISLENILEEIVGEIRDEYDNEESETMIRKTDQNAYLADGRAGIYDVEDLLDIEFPEGEPYESLGGFLTARFGKLPMVGATIEYGGWQFIVKQADEKRVKTVLIEKTKEPHADFRTQ